MYRIIRAASSRTHCCQLRRYASGKAAEDAAEAAPASARGPVSWATLGLVTVAGAAAVGYYNIAKHRKQQTAGQGKVESYGAPLLGGPWSMVDGHGVPVTSGSFPGQYLLLYFGFTFCPDICPNELVKMSRVMEHVDGKGLGHKLQPVFVTLDPARDSCAQVQHYVRQFHPRMVGLTGTPGQTAAMAKAFRVYFTDVDKGEDGESEDYLVDHSIVMYLMRPDGTLAEFYTQLMTSTEIAAKVEKQLKAA